MSRLLNALIVSVAVASPFSVQAFGFADVPGLGKKSADTSSSQVDLSGSQDLLIKQYAAASKSVLIGNSHMADAVGLAKEAAQARAASETLSDGATKGTLSDADKATSETSKLVADALKNTATMDAPAKEKFTTGMLSLAQGLVHYASMKGSVESFANGLKSASPMVLPKLQSGAYVATSLPSNVKNLATALNNAISYAQSHDIAVPKDATDALSKL